MLLKKEKNLFMVISCLVITICCVLMPTLSNASDNTNEILDLTASNSVHIIGGPQTRNLGNNVMEVSDLDGKEFFIKNAYTGQYLDIANGYAADGTNVQQYKYNGTDAQRWYLKFNGDATFSIYTRLGNNGTYLYALDISNASPDNYANVQIYSINGTNAQKFQLGCTDRSTVIIYTVVSNSTKAVVVNGPTCDQGRNVDQYTYQGRANEEWILEPVEKSYTLGQYYAKKNYNSYISAYPNLANNGGDCTNFVSQCMLASGIHFQNDWYIYRKNDTFSTPTTNAQMDVTWELADPSPWISANQFSKYWRNNSSYSYFKGSEIVANPSLAYNLPIGYGDVIQYAEVGSFGAIGYAEHTMYVTGTTNDSYLVTYHSLNRLDMNLLDLCNANPDKYFIFYNIM